jgi:hypothetical protein
VCSFSVNIDGWTKWLLISALVYIWLPRITIIVLGVLANQYGRQAAVKWVALMAEVFLFGSLLLRQGYTNKTLAQFTLFVYFLVITTSILAFCGVTLISPTIKNLLLAQFGDSRGSGGPSGLDRFLTRWNCELPSSKQLYKMTIVKVSTQSTLYYRRNVLSLLDASKLQTAQQLLCHLFSGQGSAAVMVSALQKLALTMFEKN